MDLVRTKILVAILLGLFKFIFGILPLKIYKLLIKWEDVEDGNHFINKKRHDQVNCGLAMSQSFGGGVLFATCFLHMAPEVYKSVEVLKNYGEIVCHYPISQLIISFGFFLVYFVEEFSHWFVTKLPTNFYEDKSKKQSSKKVMTKTPPNKVVPEKPLYIIEDGTKEFTKEQLQDVETMSLRSDKTYTLDVVKENEKNNELNTEKELDKMAEFENEKEKIQKLEKEMESNAINKQTVVRGILIVLALSLHAIVEGLAIGLQKNAGNIWYLCVAITIHSATIMFYISLELIIAKTKQHIILIHILVLSLTSPFGIVMGLVITVKSNMTTIAKSVAVVLLEGLSAGTILYITFFEILNREKARRVYIFRRAVCIISGFVLMALLQCAEVHQQ